MQQVVIRHKRRHATWGRIVNLSTDAAQSFAGQVAYGGPVQTGYIAADVEQNIIPSIPVGRLGTPKDIASAILFLASD